MLHQTAAGFRGGFLYAFPDIREPRSPSAESAPAPLQAVLPQLRALPGCAAFFTFHLHIKKHTRKNRPIKSDGSQVSALSGDRTLDTLIKSQVLSQLS
jgi:hypothetical protein